MKRYLEDILTSFGTWFWKNIFTCFPINSSPWFSHNLMMDDEKPHTYRLVENHVETSMNHPLHNDHNVTNYHYVVSILHYPPRRLEDLEVIIHSSIPTYEDSRALDIIND
jgi:hypothetical protein